LKFNGKIVVPIVLLVWLLVSLAFTVLIPRADAFAQNTTGCPANEAEAMTEVYSPERFRILNLCQSASGQVAFFEVWGDGDWNVYVRLDQSSRSLVDGSGIRKLQAWSQARRNGGADMIWEAIPADHENGGPLAACTPTSPRSEAELYPMTVYGVYVVDKWHGWREIHPITQATHNGQTCTRPVSETSTETSTETSGEGQCKETWGWGGRDRCK
jgi:hypothetical protein